MKREHHQWKSRHLGHDMELLVFGHAGARVIVYPTRCGRFFDYENFGLIEAIRDRIENGHLQLYCVDSVDAESIYAYWMRPEDRILRHLAFERYVLDEVLALSDHLNPGSFLIAHGCSLGGYHAMNIGLRHPTRFNKIVSFSGRFDLTQSVESFRDLFDGYHDENIYFNMPSQYLPNVGEGEYLEQLRKLRITMVIGREDPFLADNESFAAALAAKWIPHELHIWDGRAHRPKRWVEMLHLFM